MLERNGEICEHSVPDFPGLLTNSELSAYKEALSSVEEMLQEYTKGAIALTAVEKQIPKLANQVSETATVNALTIGKDGEWQIHEILHRSGRSELLLCSRQAGQETQFGIVERSVHNSIYAQARGDADLLMSSNQVSLLLQDYAEQEHRVLKLFKQDIEATAEQALAEKYPTLDCNRVIKAISARCSERAETKNETEQAQKRARNVRVRF